MLRIFVPVAIQGVVSSLEPRLEAAAGVPITQESDLNPEIPERIRAGEAYDIALTNPPYARALIEGGHAKASSHRAFGRVPLAIAARDRATASAVSDVREIGALLRKAESIAYTGAGTSGRTFLDAMERMGLIGAVLPKSRALDGGVPAVSVANGDNELAIAPLTTVLATPGVITAAVFPEHLETHIDMSVFLSNSARTGAVTMIEFLTSPDLDDELAASGISRFALT